MRLTLAMASPLLARYAFQGSCDSDPRVLQKINEARERLMKKPQNWRGKTQRFLFCSANSCITLPREIETVEAATVCNQPMKMRGPWYDVLEGGPGSGNQCGGDNVIDRGDGYVSFVDLEEPRNIKIYTDVPEASGARILLQGFDENGNRVRTFDSVTNAYVDGEYVGLNNATPQISTTVFSTLDGVVKPETNGFIRIYAFTAGTAGHGASDVTTLTNWDGENPLPGALQWGGGSLTGVTWTGVDQDVDMVLELYSFTELHAKLYNLNGNEVAGFDLDGSSFVSDGPGDPEFGVQFISTGNATFGTGLTWDVAMFIPNIIGPSYYGGQAYRFRLTRTITPAAEGVADYLALMAIYHPDETNPSYRRYEIPQLRASGSSCCGGSGDSEEATPKQVVVMAKLRYLPVKRGTDFLVIEHLGALKMMLLALNFEEKGEFTAAMQYEAKAEEILAQEIQNHIGDAATANQGMKVQIDAWAASTIPNLL